MTDKDRIKQIEQMVEMLRNTEGVTCLMVFTGESASDWNYYFAIDGFLENKYFRILINKWYLSEIETFEIRNCTDCKEEIEQLINKYLEDAQTV